LLFGSKFIAAFCYDLCFMIFQRFASSAPLRVFLTIIFFIAQAFLTVNELIFVFLLLTQTQLFLL
jgi:hypothetical protein